MKKMKNFKFTKEISEIKFVCNRKCENSREKSYA